jgi:uncharacterized protein (TIGR01244 family)
MRTHFLIAAGMIASAWLAAMPVRAQEVTKENVEGITNFHRLETTVACSGAIKATAVPEIKKFGFASIINLRQPSEDGANLEEEAAAARAADIHYYSIPFSSTAPDPAVADKFLDAITQKGSDPAFIHCAGGGRAATMWFIKRLVIDHWDIDRATKEATALGMTSPTLKQFAIDYAQTHKR